MAHSRKRRLAALHTIPLLASGPVLAALGCSHEVESPGVSAEGVTPDLVCNAQLSTPVEIRGSGFTPMPTEVLQDESVLLLPSVRLQLASDLTGGEPDDDPSYDLSGAPSGGHSDHLSWQSQSRMTAVVDEDLELNPGIYDLSVTNPDGEQAADLLAALAVVPPPTITHLVPPALCNAQSDQTLVIEGEMYLRVGDELPTVTIEGEDGDFSEQFQVDSLDGCVEIPGRDPAAEMCTSATITIPAETLVPGEYAVVLTNPAPAACASTDAVVLTVNPPPTVISVTPSFVCSGGTTLSIGGSDLQEGASVELQCADDVTVSSTATSANADGTELVAEFGPGVTVGETCDVVVTNPDSCYDEPPHQTVTGVEGPILFYVDPPVVYSDMSTNVRLFLTAVEGDATVTLEAYDPDDLPATELAYTVIGLQDNRLQATVPAGLPAGTYTIAVEDETQCAARLEAALVVTDSLVDLVTGVEPGFGQFRTATAVTIDGSGFEVTPRVFLNPESGTGEAVPLVGLTYVDATQLTAVVPADTPVGTYDVVVVNPTGEVSVLAGGYTSLADPPPVISNVLPQSIVDQSDQHITVLGTGFSGATVSLECVDEQGEPLTADPSVSTGDEVCAGDSCAVEATVDGSSIPQGGVCLVVATNSDGSFGRFSAIGVTNSSFNLSEPRAGTDLTQARRALTSAAVKATSAARFVYAVAGDTGPDTSPLASVELAPVDVYGEMGAWVPNAESLGSARAFAGSATIGRYVYVFGGSDGTDALSSGERALVLSPEEIPVIDDLDLCLAGGTAPCFDDDSLAVGLEPGTYSYRVSALIDPDDPHNLGGETLASDPTIMRLGEINGRTILVKLMWIPPVDGAGAALTGIVGYRIYRSPVDGVPGQDEVLLDEIEVGAADPLEYVDDGSTSLDTATPLPQGSTSAWQALPNLGTVRSGPAGAAAVDPDDRDRWYVYALLGKDAGSETGGATLDSYEFLPITIERNGRQTIADSWTQGTQTVAVGRWQHGAWVVDEAVTDLISGSDTYVYLGAGALADPSDSDGSVDAALVQTGGQLAAFSSENSFSSDRMGYGVAAAASRLFCFGGAAPGPRNNAIAAEIVGPPELANNAWNNEGLSMTSQRYLMGSAIQSAFVFLVGGQSTSGGAVTDSTEWVVW